MSTVYLAGGFRSKWQDNVKVSHKIIDPSKKDESQMSMTEIGEWDKKGIEECDIVFAYMERTNPSGFGLSCEIGYAHALKKKVILVLEKNHNIHPDKSLMFLTCFSDFVFDNFDDGIGLLKRME